MSNFQPEPSTAGREAGLFPDAAGPVKQPDSAAAAAAKPVERGVAPRVGSVSAEFLQDSDAISNNTAPEKESAATVAGGVTMGDVVARLQSIDESVKEIRTYIDTRARQDQHQQYSAFSVAAGAAQAVALGLMVWAFAELAFGRLYSEVLIKLAFALVIQTIALTAIVAGRAQRED